MDYFTHTAMQQCQDGTNAEPLPLPSSLSDADSQDTAGNQEDMDSTEPTSAFPQGSPADRGKRAAQSPVLSPYKAPSHKKQHWDNPDNPLQGENDIDSLAAHSDQPASEYTLKLMLLSLQKDLRNELPASTYSLHSRIDPVEERTDKLEKIITEHMAAYNDVAEVQDHHTEEIRYLWAKMADLEDRSRRNNIKFRGIPETIKPPELLQYLQKLFLKLLPRLTQADITLLIG